MSDTRLIEAALAAGAAGAVLIPQRQIVLSAEFRRICEGNACGYYGRCWMCPPDTGDIETAMAQVRRYPWALLYQTIGAIEDSFDIEGMEEGARPGEPARPAGRQAAFAKAVFAPRLRRVPFVQDLRPVRRRALPPSRSGAALAGGQRRGCVQHRQRHVPEIRQRPQYRHLLRDGAVGGVGNGAGPARGDEPG